MKLVVVVISALALLLGGEWTYRCFLRPIDPLPAEVLKLADHFRSNGLDVRPYAVRHGYRHSEVTASAGFEIAGYPLAISVAVCPTSAAADAYLPRVTVSPNLMPPTRNGRLVMDLPMWGDDTSAMAKRVTDAFSTFAAGT